MKASLSGIIISGLLLAGLPFLVIAKHWHVESRAPRFELMSEISVLPDAENMELRSEINRLDLSELSGTDAVEPRDSIYVHMATGPGMIAYPFSVTREKPMSKTDGYAFSIRGSVVERKDDIITVRYNFETFLPSRKLEQKLIARQTPNARIELAVNEQSIARLVNVRVDGESYPYRVIERPVLGGVNE